MANFKPIKCTKAKMDTKAKTEGQLFFTTDTKKIYLDTSTSERIELTANPTPNVLTSEDLSTIKTPGLYEAGGNNSVTNKPSGVDAFGLFVYKTANGYITQELTEGNKNPLKKYIRQFNAGSWSAWKIFAYTDSSITGNAATATKATQDSAGNNINTTYIKSLSLNTSTKKMTYTKGNGSTGTISMPFATQDDINNLKYDGSYLPLTTSLYNSVVGNISPEVIPDVGIDISLESGQSGTVYFSVSNEPEVLNTVLEIKGTSSIGGITIWEYGGEGMDYNMDWNDMKTIVSETGMIFPMQYKLKIMCDAANETQLVTVRRVSADTSSVSKTQYLPTNNTIDYEPTDDYNPATKKYVDNNKGASNLIVSGKNIYWYENETYHSGAITYSNATTSESGLMSSTDKSTLNKMSSLTGTSLGSITANSNTVTVDGDYYRIATSSISTWKNYKYLIFNIANTSYEAIVVPTFLLSATGSYSSWTVAKGKYTLTTSVDNSSGYRIGYFIDSSNKFYFWIPKTLDYGFKILIYGMN